MSFPYPKATIILLICELLERFSFYGMRALLVLYMINSLGVKEKRAKSFYHIFYALINITPLLGAIISDSWLEKFKTILFASIIYAAGNFLLYITSLGDLPLPPLPFTMLSLVIIAVGCGAKRPCFTAFAGDQFKLPEQEHLMSKFFLIFYLCVNVGSVSANLLCPFLKSIKCRGQESCYQLAFLPTTISMIIFLLLFILGRAFYKVKNQPQGNIFLLVSKCIFYAMRKKCSSSEKTDHWLDHANDKYDAKTIDDIKKTLNVLLIFVPIPIFWALFDQQASDWIILAARLNGDVGFMTILPEQILAVNPASIVMLIPLFHSVIYPCFMKYRFCDTALKRMSYGGLLPTASFTIAALLHIAVRRDLPPMPQSGMIQLRGYNPTNKPISVEVSGLGDFKSFEIPAFGLYENLEIAIEGKKEVTFNNESLTMSGKKAYGVYAREDKVYPFKDYLEKPNDGNPRVRTLLDVETNISYINQEGGKDVKIEKANYSSTLVNPGSYRIEGIDTTLQFKTGGVYVVLVDTTSKKVNVIVLLKENTICILWLLPQILMMAAGEIMISVTGLEFAYSQAPTTMKSFLQACWNLTNAIGNVIVVLVMTYIRFTHPAYDAALFAILMFLNVLLLVLIAKNYKYNTVSNEETTAAEEN